MNKDMWVMDKKMDKDEDITQHMAAQIGAKDHAVCRHKFVLQAHFALFTVLFWTKIAFVS